MVRLVALVALLCSCKSMNGLGHVASGLGHVASAAGHVAGEVGHIAAPLAKVASRAAPVVLKAAETAVEIAALAPGDAPLADPDETPGDPPPQVSQVSWLDGPLIDNHDPCNACPEDLACDQCEGAGGAACRWAAPGAFTRCESGTPR